MSLLTGDQESALSHYITAGVAGLGIAQVRVPPWLLSRMQPLAPSASFVRLCIQTHSPLVSRSTLPKFSRRSTSESRQQLQLTQRTAAAQLTACALKSRSLFSYAEFRNGASPLSGGIEPGQSPAPSDSTAVVCADMLILIVCCSASQNVEAKLRLADA